MRICTRPFLSAVATTGLSLSILLASSPAWALAYQSGGIVYLNGHEGEYIGYLDPTTGKRSVLVQNAALGIGDPHGVSVGPDGAIYLVTEPTHPTNPSVYRLDPTTNGLTLVSGAASAGPDVGFSRDIDVTASGEIIGTGISSGDAVVYQVDPLTGARTILSGAGVGAGTGLNNIRHMDVGPDGQIYVTARLATGDDVLFQVDPGTGDRTILFSETEVGEWPRDVVVSALGDVYVAVLRTGAVWRWDAGSGLPVLLNDTADGNRLIEVAPDGTIYTVDSDGSGTYVDAVDPITGVRTRVMDTSTDPGPTIRNLRDFAMIPAGIDLVALPEPARLSLLLAFGALAAWRARRSTRA